MWNLFYYDSCSRRFSISYVEPTVNISKLKLRHTLIYYFILFCLQSTLSNTWILSFKKIRSHTSARSILVSLTVGQCLPFLWSKCCRECGPVWRWGCGLHDPGGGGPFPFLYNTGEGTRGLLQRGAAAFFLSSRDKGFYLVGTPSFVKFRYKYPKNWGKKRKSFRFNVSLNE